MGGFHGGHSGGGFHGGHSSSHGGSRSTTHVYVGGHHYYHGKRYYGPYYGDSDGEPMKFSTAVGISLVLIFIGLMMFFVMFGVREDATIIKAQLTNDGYDTYETYDFEYYHNGKRYTGFGDDDVRYVNGQPSLSIEVGEVYPIYVNLILPTNYEFENNNVMAVIVLAIFGSIGVFMLFNAIKTKKEYEKKLASIGDFNHDGKLDEHDIESYESSKKGESDGTYEGMKKATSENVYNKEKIRRYCKYCGKEADDDALFCSGCGASL